MNSSRELHARPFGPTSLIASLIVVLALISSPWSTAHAQAQADTQPKLALGGFCPVCLTNMKQWMPGKPEFSVVYDDHEYRFPSQTEQQIFQENPAKFVPAFHGDCTVCFTMMNGRRVQGSLQHGLFYDDRAYFFPSADEAQMFSDNPSRFADADLAFDGQCPVCRVEMNQGVPGKPEFTVIHGGFRYQFPSAQEQQMFLDNPERYALDATSGENTPSQAQASPNDDDAQLVSFQGRSGCAGCQHGVFPIGSPNELGLAIKTPDGRVIIVEDAHELYPKVYDDRFGALNLRVTGQVIQTRDQFVWVQPDRLTVVR